MPSVFKISQHTQFLVIVLGLIVAMSSAGSFWPGFPEDTATRKEASKQGEDDHTKEVSLISFDVISQSLSINLPAFLYIGELVVVEEASSLEENEGPFFISATTFFKTLFRRIISPNAP